MGKYVKYNHFFFMPSFWKLTYRPTFALYISKQCSVTEGCAFLGLVGLAIITQNPNVGA